MQTRQQGLEGTGEVTLRDLVREALRMRPTRMIVGEVRVGRVPGPAAGPQRRAAGLATIHANSAREALVKLCTVPLLAGENISSRFVVPTVACVHRPRGAPRHRRPGGTAGQRGRGGSRAASRTTSSRLSPCSQRTCDRLVRAAGMPSRLESFERAGIDVHDPARRPADGCVLVGSVSASGCS
jgi:pilus assembly protein CpaF